MFGKYDGPMPFQMGDEVKTPDGVTRTIVQIDRHVYPIVLRPATIRYKPESLKLVARNPKRNKEKLEN